MLALRPDDHLACASCDENEDGQSLDSDGEADPCIDLTHVICAGDIIKQEALGNLVAAL